MNLQAKKAEYADRIAGVKLRPLAPTGAVAAPAAEPARKYEALQELAAERQETLDLFSDLQLELLELKNRAGAEPPAAVPQALSAGAAEAAEPPAITRSMPRPAGIPPARPAAPQSGGSRSRLTLLLAAAAACVGVLSLFILFGSGDEDSFSLPPSSAAGLCLSGGADSLYFVDPQRQLLITVSIAERRVRAMHSFAGEKAKGLAFDGERFWSTDGRNIYRHAASAGYPVLDVYSAGRPVHAICWDGGSLWAAADDGKLVNYGGFEKQSRETVYNMPAGGAAGIYVDEGKLWLLDPGTGLLRAYLLDGGMKKTVQVSIKSMLPKGRLAGFAVSGGYVWVITDSPAELRRIKLEEPKP